MTATDIVDSIMDAWRRQRAPITYGDLVEIRAQLVQERAERDQLQSGYDAARLEIEVLRRALRGGK